MEEDARIIGASALLRSAVELDEAAFLAEVQAESIGWLPLGDGAYLHLGDPDALVVDVVGVLDAGMAGMNVMWVVG